MGIGKVTIHLGRFEDEDREEIFKIANRLATQIGLKIVHVTDGKGLVDPSGLEEVYLDYKIVVNLTPEAKVEIDELEVHVRFATSGFAIFTDEKKGLTFSEVPSHLQPALKPGGLLFSWLVQGQIITSAICNPLDEILKGATDIKAALQHAFPQQN